MGLVRFGAPEELILRLKNACAIDTFVETGTYIGGTAAWAAQHFQRVVTIEAAESLYLQNKAKLGAIPNLEMLHGDSRNELQQVLSSVENPAIIWLDSHFCAGPTAGLDDQCPLMDELAIIERSKREHLILIDDANLFLSPPGLYHNSTDWPAIADVVNSLSRLGYYVAINEDVIIAVPQSARSVVESYCREVNDRHMRARMERDQHPLRHGFVQVGSGLMHIYHVLRAQAGAAKRRITGG